MAGAGGGWPSMPPPLIGVEPSGSPLLFCGKDIAQDVCRPQQNKQSLSQVVQDLEKGSSVRRALPGPSPDVTLGLTG
jgi:hypothetical protein